MPNESSDKIFQNAVYNVVKNIPLGYVLTYGRIAVLAGRPSNSRLVGKLLSLSPEDVPAHRVVNHNGRTVPGWAEQKLLLKKENVAFKQNGNVDMRRHLWKNY